MNDRPVKFLKKEANLFAEIQGDLLKLIFLFSLLLGLGTSYRPVVTLKISLTSFHFRVYKWVFVNK